MSMQLRSIVLYSLEGIVREVPFQLGRVNLVIGPSESGKTALLDIVDYCLASDSCNIPRGLIRDSVSWFAVILAFETYELFIARRTPPGEQKTSHEFYVLHAATVALPPFEDLKQTTTLNAVEDLLTQHIGITPNKHFPPPGRTSPPLEANIRHSLFYCFQRQNEIASQELLFHTQGREYMPQHIRDTMPFFLGATADSQLSKRQELRQARVRQASLRRRLEEIRLIRGVGLERSAQLIAEARQLGMVGEDRVLDTHESVVSFLNEIKDTENLSALVEESRAGSEIARLEDLASDLLRSMQDVRTTIAAARAFQKSQDGYIVEANEQKRRLESIGLFSNKPDVIEQCPLCNANLDSSHEVTQHVESSISTLAGLLKGVEEEKPRVDQYIFNNNERLAELSAELDSVQSSIKALRSREQRFVTLRTRELARAQLAGRVALYLESTSAPDESNALQKEFALLEGIIQELEEFLSHDRVRATVESQLRMIGEHMSKLARRLNLEHSQFPLTISLRHLTVVADTKKGPYPLYQIGSAKNWVGYHLVAYLALQKWFIQNERPVPQFIMFDQPSQVHFGSRAEDLDAVLSMYHLMIDEVNSLNESLQVITTDHATFENDSKFRAAVTHDWWTGEKLIPAEWINSTE